MEHLRTRRRPGRRPRLPILSLPLLLALALSRPAPAREAARSLSPPEWIWSTQEATPGQRVTLRVAFEGAASVEEARLRCAADFCRAEIDLNGRPLLTIEDYGPWVDEVITHRVAPGSNVLSIRCTASEGPSALALSLTLSGRRGATRQVVTGPGWKVREDGAPSTDVPAGSVPVWTNAASFGPVAAELWEAWTRSIEVSPFDDYEQWRDALGGSGERAPSSFLVPDGFQVETLRSAGSDEGSWVSLAFDPAGRIVIAREDRGLLRMNVATNGGIAGVETINDSLLECRGLLFAHDALYASANVSRGLYRLRDTTGDERFDEVTLLREFPGGAGHGRNDLALGPDGMIYGIHGDSVDVPTRDVLDLTSPYREARRGGSTREGHVLRTDPDGERWELVCAGLRNPFGIDFHPEHGELFTYDADAEHDMGSPWYRPTRVVHLVAGADYGWRGVTGQWPPYDPDRPENGLPVLDIGKGSPTAVKFAHRSRFPPRYRDALFILDWAYGRILAVHLVPRGAGYTGRAEVFLRGRPLNVTDLDFGPDGALYVVTGGRKTQSALYRVRYVGPQVARRPLSAQEKRRRSHSQSARELRRRLEAALDGAERTAVSAVWPYLDRVDPALRHAARVVLERQPVDGWRNRALAEQRPRAALTALLALARGGRADVTPDVLRRLGEIDFATLDTTGRLTFLRVLSLGLERGSRIEPATLAAWRSRLSGVFPGATGPALVPIGIGRSTDRELSRLLVALGSRDAVARAMRLLAGAASQEDRLHFLRVLSRAREGWTEEMRREYFGTLREAQRVHGGRGMPGFVQTIRDQALETLTPSERERLAALIDPPAVAESEPLPARPFVKEWTMEDLARSLDEVGRERDYAAGRRMFREAGCSRCHRVGTIGEAMGPDLTAVAARFSRRDILESVLSPSLVVAPPYRNVEIVTTDGRILVGQIVAQGDYRSRVLKIATDPLRPARVEEVRKQDVQLHRESETSPMPEGLLNPLSREEILDLLAYLESGGNEAHPVFRGDGERRTR